jgi:hypothetical protein
MVFQGNLGTQHPTGPKGINRGRAAQVGDLGYHVRAAASRHSDFMAHRPSLS